jgi:hypothetical protein
MLSNGKGHPNYYKGKRVGIDDFIDAYNAVLKCELSVTQAAKKLCVSTPTFRKWFAAVWNNGNSLEGLYFIRENQDV